MPYVKKEKQELNATAVDIYHCYIHNSWHGHVEHMEFGAYLHFFYFICLIRHRNRYEQHYVMCKDQSFSLTVMEKYNSNYRFCFLFLLFPTI